MAKRGRGSKVVVVAAVTGLIAAGGIAIAVADAFDSTDTSVSEVAVLAQQEPTIPAGTAFGRTVDGVGFPNWTRWGWKPVGGRTDRSADDRVVATVVYRKGDDKIAYSIVEGTEWVSDDFGGRWVKRTPPEGTVEFNVSGVDASIALDLPEDQCAGGSQCTLNSGVATTVHRKINERNVILTAWPYTEKLADEVQDMALRTKR